MVLLTACHASFQLIASAVTYLLLYARHSLASNPFFVCVEATVIDACTGIAQLGLLQQPVVEF